MSNKTLSPKDIENFLLILAFTLNTQRSYRLRQEEKKKLDSNYRIKRFQVARFVWQNLHNLGYNPGECLVRKSMYCAILKEVRKENLLVDRNQSLCSRKQTEQPGLFKPNELFVCLGKKSKL